MTEEKKNGYTVIDRRGQEEKDVEVCRVCASKEVHTRDYNVPTMECVNHLWDQIRTQEDLLLKAAKILAAQAEDSMEDVKAIIEKSYEDNSDAIERHEKRMEEKDATS
jgi:hypothetical protein